jgi:hypothetical protein
VLAIAGAIGTPEATETAPISQPVIDAAQYPILSQHWGLDAADVAQAGRLP